MYLSWKETVLLSLIRSAFMKAGRVTVGGTQPKLSILAVARSFKRLQILRIKKKEKCDLFVAILASRLLFYVFLLLTRKKRKGLTPPT